MPIAILLLFLAPAGVATVGLHQEYVKENKVNEMCIQKFKTPDDIKSCKAILMKMNINEVTK